ncbi:MAG: adenine phosphoribosyltransferase [Corynebacterium sp.]|nr:adenine phosphoribosyltransferase [Corynebacterium sp.]
MTAQSYSHVREALHQKTRLVPDFPVEGVVFEDLTPVLADAEAFRLLVDDLATAAENMGAELISGLDARGFLLGSAVAYKIGLGLLAIRKQGKLPPPVCTKEYALEYGTAALELPASGIDLTDKKVVLIDDVLATGGTLIAARDLITDLGGEVAGYCVVLEVTGLHGRDRLAGTPLFVVNEPQ